jgi:hypothetical protein
VLFITPFFSGILLLLCPRIVVVLPGLSGSSPLDFLSLIKEIFIIPLFDKIKGACILETQILGLVKEGKFIPVKSSSSIAAELEKSGITLIRNIAHIAEAQAPIPLDLTGYEGKVIMVGGRLEGGTMYTAEVIDEAGPILTTVVLELFGKHSSL